jgi:hypothetical protein
LYIVTEHMKIFFGILSEVFLSALCTCLYIKLTSIILLLCHTQCYCGYLMWWNHQQHCVFMLVIYFWTLNIQLKYFLNFTITSVIYIPQGNGLLLSCVTRQNQYAAIALIPYFRTKAVSASSEPPQSWHVEQFHNKVLYLLMQKVCRCHNIVTCMCVTIEKVLDYWIYWPLTGCTTNNYNTISISTLYSSLLCTLVSSFCYSLHCPFPGNRF